MLAAGVHGKSSVVQSRHDTATARHVHYRAPDVRTARCMQTAVRARCRAEPKNTQSTIAAARDDLVRARAQRCKAVYQIVIIKHHGGDLPGLLGTIACMDAADSAGR